MNQNWRDLLTMSLFGISIAILLTMAVSNSEYVPLMNVIFAGLLTLITAAYVVITRNILEDNSKNRQIDFISKQLEELYYPLWEFLNRFTVSLLSKEYAIKDINGILAYEALVYNYDSHIKVGEGAMMATHDMSPFLQKRYLFKSDYKTKMQFEQFAYDKRLKYDTAVTGMCGLYNNLKQAVKKDIDSLEKELNELTSN